MLDIERPAGRAAFERLAASADIVLDGLAVGRMDALGLGASALRAANPRLIYTYITPFGRTGPWSKYASSDLVQLALGGTMAMTGYDDLPGYETYPIAPAGGQGAHFAGLMAAIATTAALNARRRTGRGQEVGVAAQDAVSIANINAFPHWEYEGEHVHRHTARHASSKKSTPRQMFKCRDGKHVICMTLYLREPAKWNGLVAWLNTHGLAEDLGEEKFQSQAYRKQNHDRIMEVLDRFCAQIDSTKLFREAQRLRLPWGPVNPVWDLLDDPHLHLDRGAIVEVEQPELGRKVAYGGAPCQFGASPWSIRSTAPSLGRDNHLLGEVDTSPRERRELT